MPPPTRRAWYYALSAITALVEVTDRELRTECGTPLAYYDVLVEVHRSPGHQIRMSELADRVLLSRSWVTRRVKQLEDEGLLTRIAAADDHRGVIAAMTAKGMAVFQDLEASHTASIERHFACHLGQEDATVIAERFRVISEAARASLGLQVRDGLSG